MKNKFKIIFLIIIGIIFSSILLVNNPILIKYLTGTARLIGKPIESKVYVDGILDDKINIYKVHSYWNGQKADYYLLDFGKMDSTKFYRIISLNIQDNYVGLPSSTNSEDYDVFLGSLYQGEVGANFTDINNGAKGLGFQPNFHINNKRIKLNLPKEYFNIDSIRIEL